jgi:hypothetical protein
MLPEVETRKRQQTPNLDNNKKMKSKEKIGLGSILHKLFVVNLLAFESCAISKLFFNIQLVSYGFLTKIFSKFGKRCYISTLQTNPQDLPRAN